MRQKKSLKKILMIGLNLLLLLILFSTTTNIRAKEEKASKATPRMGSITIDADSPNDSFQVPKDASGNHEPSFPADYVQEKGKRPNFKVESLNSYSTTSGDSVNLFSNRYIQPLDNGEYLVVSSSRNDADVIADSQPGSGKIPLRLYTINVLKVDRYGEILDQLNLQTGTPYDPFNMIDTLGSGLYSANASPIFVYGNQEYGITYGGLTPSGGFDYRVAILKNTSSGITITGRHENLPWSVPRTQNLEAIRPIFGTNKLAVYGYWNISQSVTEPQFMEVYEFDKQTNSFPKLVNLAHEKYSDKLSIIDPSDYGVWLYDLRETNDGYFGRVVYSSVNLHNTHKKQVLYKWDYSGNLLSERVETNVEGATILHEISDKETVYYYNKGTTETVLYKLDTATFAVKEIKKYPAGTTFKINEQPDTVHGIQYVLYGNVLHPEDGEFSEWIEQGGTVLAYLDKDFDIINASGVKVDDGQAVDFAEIDDLDGTHLFVAGNTLSKTFSKVPKDGWATKAGTFSTSNIFFGAMKKVDDYPPGIKFNDKLVVQMDDPGIDWDKALLAGVEVYDTFDVGDNLNGELTKLKEKINLNPKAPTNPIDWKGLGLNKAEIGPQWIKYFIKDSSNQITASSRLLNGVDEHTDYDKTNPKNFLRADNFDIHIKDVENLSKVSAKAAAELKAWHTASNGNLIDDGTASKDVAKVNQTELQAIKDAKIAYDAATTAAEKAKVIRPYSLTFTYEDRMIQITVFVTDDTTAIEKDVVLYGFNFEESIKKVKNITSDEVKNLAFASAWDYKMKWGSSELPTSNLSVDLTHSGLADPKLTGLNLVTIYDQSYQVKFNYQDSSGKKVSNHLPTAYVYGKPARLHIRQVIVDTASDIVIPTTGYLLWENRDGIGNQASETNIKTNTLTDDTNQKFTLNQLEMAFDHWFYLVHPVVPEYYQYVGYVASTADPNTTKAHEEKDKIVPAVQPLPNLDYRVEEEYWLTIYLKPIPNTVPKPYSWDYQKQEIGELTP